MSFVLAAFLTTLAMATDPEAPAGFDGKTNGFTSQTVFDEDLEVFNEQEDIDEGLGPVFNARACGDCHATPTSGGSSQVSELRAGHFNGSIFIDAAGGSLINDRAIDASIQERVLLTEEVRTFRASNSVLGLGFVEAIANSTLQGIANNQPFSVRGTIINVPVNEANNTLRIGRFGWKNQHASLVSFSADAYLNEMGITSPLQPNENTSKGRSVAAFDEVPDPEDTGEDVEAFARFMRATKVPARDTALANTFDAKVGSQLFVQIGCGDCHTPDIVTAPAGTQINGGAFVVPPALGGKLIHPYSDFLLHDVGTGDGIVQNGGQGTRNKLRTAPLWGLRTRSRLMHDLATVTRTEAILRHAGQATGSVNKFKALSANQRSQLITFLTSL
jgi:CxxC motif-containing protein (DUF1111 family)